MTNSAVIENPHDKALRTESRCEECGEGFTLQQWLNRYGTDVEYHAECAPEPSIACDFCPALIVDGEEHRPDWSNDDEDTPLPYAHKECCPGCRGGSH